MTTRRRFLGLAGMSAAALGTGAADIQAPVGDPAPSLGLLDDGPWDLRWIDELGGKHRQVFDLGHPDLQAVGNYLRAFRDVYGLSHPDVVAVIGIASYSYPVNATDAIWSKYELGRRWQITDPQTGAPATRNIFAMAVPDERPIAFREASIPALLSRGVRFWQCANALGGVAAQLARDTSQEPEAVRTELLGGLQPWVHLVPAHVMLVGLLQERGFAYEHLM